MISMAAGRAWNWFPPLPSLSLKISRRYCMQMILVVAIFRKVLVFDVSWTITKCLIFKSKSSERTLPRLCGGESLRVTIPAGFF